MSADSPSTIPVHVAIIPDGNRRWAKGKGLPTLEGHAQGVEAMRQTAERAFDRGIKYLTFYLFSTENWSRPRTEIRYLIKLFYKIATVEVQKLHARNIRVQFIGSREGLEAGLLKVIDEAHELTARNTKGVLTLCLNYGGQQEIADAYRSLAQAGIQPEDINPELVSKHLYAPEVPPVDLMIRSSGEQRMSGFMLWRSTYAEFYFTDVLWPDFDEAQLDLALADYASRQRRFGQ